MWLMWPLLYYLTSCFVNSSYFLFSSLTGHLSVPWMRYLFLLPGKFCVYTPLPYSSFRFELFKEAQIFGHSRLGEVQNTYYMLSCTFSLLTCTSVWLFPLPSFLSTMCQVVTIIWSSAQWKSSIQYSYNKWIWVVSACSGLNCVPSKFHVLKS